MEPGSDPTEAAAEPRPRSRALRWGAAVVLSLAGFALTRLPGIPSGRAPALFLVPAIVAAAWYGGIGAGLLATALTGAAFLWQLQQGAVRLDLGAAMLLACYGLLGVALAWMGGRARTLVADLRRRRDAMEQALARSRLHQRVTAALTGALSHEEAMTAFARVMVETLADYCITYVLDGPRLRRVGLAHAEPAQEPLVRQLADVEPPRLADERGAGFAVRTGKPIVATDIDAALLPQSTSGPEHLRIIQALAPRSSLVLPLAARGHMVGAVALATTDRSSRRFTAADLDAVQELMASAALALDNVRLLDVARLQAQRRTDLQRLFVDAGRRLPSTLAADEALRQLARLASEHLADLAIVDLLEPRAGHPGVGSVRRVEVATRVAERQQVADQLRNRYPPDLRNEGHPATRALLRGEPTLLPSIDDDALRAAARDASHLEMMRALGPSSSLTVPVAARGHAIGALTLSSLDPERPLGRDDVEIAGELATIAGLALDNARLYEELQEAVRMRDDILAVVAHDLRNPLHVVGSLVSVLEARAAGQGEATQPLQAMRRSLERAERLIQDLLDISRIEAGRFTVHAEPLQPALVLAEVRESAEVQARERHVVVACEAPARCGDVRADRARLVQALHNLVDNALSHSPAGGRVRIAVEEREAEVWFAVADDGPGIHPDDVTRLFDRFWQARERRGGAGLGLAIVKGIVEAHGGRVWVESELGRGSTFRFALPRVGATAAAVDDAGRGAG